MARTGKVEDTIEGLNTAMAGLRASLRGIPIRQGSFRNLHDQAARAVACVVVMLETHR
ncbi:MAG: hypothetical protein ACRDTG_02835 [Pseudonocardiaceae bacterium]